MQDIVKEISGVGHPDYGETVDKLIDGDLTTKWFNGEITTGAFPPFTYSGDPAVVTFELYESHAFTGYRWATAVGYVAPHSESDRDPRSWRVEASNDGTNWTVLHQVEGYESSGHPHWQGGWAY